MEFLLALLFQSTGAIDIVFCPEHDCESFLIENLKKNTAECAFYHVTNQELFELAVIHVDSSNYKGQGIPIQSKGLMHHKFCVLNKTHVLFGSANPTANLNHHNNMLLVESKVFVWNFRNELRRLKGKKHFFIKNFYYNGYKTSHLFCQTHNCQNKLYEVVRNANSVRFLFFTFTDKRLATLLNEKYKVTNNVSGVIEGWQNTNFWAVPDLKDTPHKINNGVIQHNKLLITDQNVVTGSLNPTNNGYNNNDEFIVVFSQPEIVKAYTDYFERVW